MVFKEFLCGQSQHHALGDVEKTGYCPKKDDSSHFLYFWLLFFLKTKHRNLAFLVFIFAFEQLPKPFLKNSIFKLLVFNFTFWQKNLSG
jgi:hypothetical protein